MRGAACLLGLLAGLPLEASARPGISARFGGARAVEGRPLVLRVELDDAIGAVERVELAVTLGESRLELAASRESERWWTATVDAALIPPAPGTIEVRARILGARGGLLLELGGLEPFEVPIVTRGRDAEEVALLERVQRAEAPLPIVGYVGADARLGSNARARGVLGVAFDTGSLELGVEVSVGPSFAAPSALAGGGPVVLGFGLGARMYGWPPSAGWTPWGELFTITDARLPGLDLGLGARAGISWRIEEAIAVEVGVGGAAMAFALSEAPSFGASGGLRALLRFGESGP